MYTLMLLPICIPVRRLAVSLSAGRHAIRFHKSRIPKNAVPFGFCCGGFSSTAGYVPGNEAYVRRRKRLAAASRPIISSESATAFLSASLKVVFRLPEAKPFGFGVERQ
jgi:hypothetical protein